MSERISEKLRKFRKNCGLTQQQVANALNIDRTTYTCYECAKTEPNIETLGKLTKIFNVSYTDLLPEGNEKNERLLDSHVRTNQNSKETIYELSKFEQNILLKLRLMSIEERFAIFNQLDNINNESNKDN